MGGKHCSWGKCSSDSRYPKTGVTFIPFPKPNKFPDKAKRWAHLCGRGEAFTCKNITKDTYICSLHFPEGSNLDHKRNPELEPFNARREDVKSVTQIGTARSL